MDFEAVPEEIFLQILAFLDVKDLLSCSMVSRNWREMVNKDRIWKHICSRRSETKKTILFLENQEKCPNQMSVEEVFNESSGPLRPLCKWRLNYMRYAQITNKIQTGNNCMFKITYPEYCSAFKIVDCFVVLLINSKNLIEIWNIKNEPYRQDIIKFSLRLGWIDFVEIVDDLLVVVQQNLLQVYKTNGSTFVLQYRRLFHLPQENSECMPHQNDITDWYKEKIKRRTIYLCAKYIVCGDYFVGFPGYTKSHGLLIIHIWNIKTGNKVKELEVPNFQVNLHGCDIYFHSNHKNLFIILNCKDGVNEYYRIIEYNLKDLKFSNLNIEIPYYPMNTLNIFLEHSAFIYVSENQFCSLMPDVIFKDTFVITLGSVWKTLIIWEAETGKKLANTSFNYPVLPKTLDVYDSYVGFIEYKSADKEMNVVIINFKENYFENVYSIRVNFEASGLRFLHCSLISIESASEIEVWDIKKSQKLYTIDGEFYPTKNHERTKVHSLPTPNELQLQIMRLPLWFSCYKIFGYSGSTNEQDKPLQIYHTV